MSTFNRLPDNNKVEYREAMKNLLMDQQKHNPAENQHAYVLLEFLLFNPKWGRAEPQYRSDKHKLMICLHGHLLQINHYRRNNGQPQPYNRQNN